MSKEKLTVGASIAESYRFLFSHLPHFFRLIYGPLILWVLIMLSEQVLLREYHIKITGLYFLNIITAAFAIIWYRQFLLGAKFTSYRQLIKHGFSDRKLSIFSVLRTILRITVITLALLIPTLLLSISMMVYYHGQGVTFSDEVIRELAMKSTVVVMLIFSPIFVRFSLYTAGFALGRTSLGFSDVWKRTSGYTVTLWWVAIRAFLPLSIYSYVVGWLLDKVTEKMEIHYVMSTIITETFAGFITFLMLSIVVAANAEAFRVIIGVRDGDAPHRESAGQPRKAGKAESESLQQAE